MGIKKENIIIPDIGNVLSFDGVGVNTESTVPSGRIMVDGLGVGDVGSVVLRDRKHLAQDGVIIVVSAINRKNMELVSGPDIVSRGFVYVRESEVLMEEAKAAATKVIEEALYRGVRDYSNIKSLVRDRLSNFLYHKTKRSPMILTVIMEV